MRYTVTWQRTAFNHLGMLWLEASDRRAVQSASDRIDRELLVDPQTKGVKIDDRFRKLSIDPLSVLFAVSEEDRLVTVVSVALRPRA